MIAFLIGGAFFINPNPFGNQPSVIGDETYFLTSAIKAIQNHTLPGWIHDPTAAYYGGVLTYIIFVLVAVGGAVSIFFGAHANTIAPWISFYWGDLVHIGRLVNGAVVYVSLVWLIVECFKLSKQLKNESILWFGFFIVTLLCSGSIFIPLTHTSKVWPLYAVIEILAGWSVVSREWSIRQGGAPTTKSLYINTLILLTLLSWSQVMLGSLTFLWIADAVMLKHISIRDVLAALKRSWMMVGIGLFILIHLSFIQNFFQLARQLSHFNNVRLITSSSLHPWFDRAAWPWEALWSTHPLLAVLFFLACLRLVLKRSSIKLTHVIFLHLALVYFLFYIVLGFGVDLRYELPFTVMVIFVVALSLMHEMSWYKTIGALCMLGSIAVLTKTALLFWQPSSIKRLDVELRQAPISSRALVIIKSGYFQVPILNKASIAFTDQSTDVPVFRRFRILEDSSFQNNAFPFTISVGVPRSIPRAQFDEIWLIDEQNKTSCSSTKNLCFEFNGASSTSLNTTLVAEGVNMKNLFKAKMIGKSYILLKMDKNKP